MTADARPRLSVSLNGVDNIGKSTQLAWLHTGTPNAHLVGTVSAWDSRWREVAKGDFASWWFINSTTAEHVALVLGSHAARRDGSGPLALEDRGAPMLRATCAATAVLKEGLSPVKALRLVERIEADLPVAAPRHETHVLLRRSADTTQEAAEALRREPQPVNARYTAYQHTLAEVLSIQVNRGEYQAVLDLGFAPILDVQCMLRARLAAAGIAVEPLPGDALSRLWVLGGLSESGKSTVGDLLRHEHGVTRLKIGYLLDVAAMRAGVSDPYEEWSEHEQTQRLSEEVLRFAQANKARAISVESAHRFQSTSHLKRAWGQRCQVVFVDSDPSVRAQRATETKSQLRNRDAIKRERGAARVADIADHTIDNSGTLGALKFAVNRMALTVDLPRVGLHASKPATHSNWLEQATEHLLDEEVACVLATGSTGTTSWREGWSDLDLLLVRDTAPAAWLRDVAGCLPEPEGIKVGLSVFTKTDIDALRVPPRVVQALRRAAQGEGLLYRRAGYLLPVPNVAHGDRTSRGELGLVVMTTRRLLAQPQPDVRAVHKHLVLLAKLVLRADGHDLHTADEVLTAWRSHHPAAECTPPDLSDLIRRSTDPVLRDQLVEATDRLLTYLDQLDHTGRTSR